MTLKPARAFIISIHTYEDVLALLLFYLTYLETQQVMGNGISDQGPHLVSSVTENPEPLLACKP